ncbi:solute:sodium symporter family transporter [Pelagicoccus enzymogenes]|uniref:solute:sodium symporter family transporter n=1 Tax=Pelagicoccus enzymogenes TaxID=2773457 RepID=UPI00280DB308|nr:solute:sodium symporter family transporter [Pelagicoccus enzymogenes]
MTTWIFISFLAFTGFAAFLTWWITRRDERSSSDGYFLGGRTLTFPIIAGSLLLTNLSTEQMVGLNGAAFNDGLSVMAWEVVAVLALVVMTLFFLPRFLKGGITTVPQFLELRYDRQTQSIGNFIFLIAYAFLLLPIILYSGAVGLSHMMDLKSLTGIDEPVELLGNVIPPETVILWLTVFTIGIMGLVYSRFGGLRTLAVLDTINGVGLLVGGMTIVFFALDKVSDGGGVLEGWNMLREAEPERLSSIGKSGQSVPFSTLFTGVALLNLFYWCTNQQIIQRTLGASSLAEGQKGVLLTAGLKLLGPIYLVIPGIVAYHLYSGTGIGADLAYGKLVFDVLPAPLTGFFAAVMVGAILSSFNAGLNSTSALFSLGLYKHIINPKGTERQVVRSAKIFVVLVAVMAMLIAPALAGQESIFKYLQKMNGIYFIPIFSVVVVGLLNRRVPAVAGRIGLVTGIVLIALGYFLPGFSTFLAAAGIHEFHFLGIVFALIVGLMHVVGAVKPRSEPWVMVATNEVDMTPWKNARWASLALVALVIAIYVAFAF